MHGPAWCTPRACRWPCAAELGVAAPGGQQAFQLRLLCGALLLQALEPAAQLLQDATHGGAMLRGVGVHVKAGVDAVTESPVRLPEQLVQQVVVRVLAAPFPSVLAQTQSCEQDLAPLVRG